MVNTINKRKTQHIKLCLKRYNQSKLINDFNNYQFEHNALPEINYSDIDTTVIFLKKRLKYPFLISPITGGSEISIKINQNLAKLAQKFGIVLSVGSQRSALENKNFISSFDIRKFAPDIPILANLGAVQLNYGYGIEECQKAIDMIGADALVLHLNPLQEVFQSEGNTNFYDLQKKISNICNKLNVPVIVKEIGYGISYDVANRLYQAGVKIIDIAGSGSISWSCIEAQRQQNISIKMAAKNFKNWGNSTAKMLKILSNNFKDVTLIASGGIKNGIDIAKAIAMGASLCGNALKFLQTTYKSEEKAEIFINEMIFELKTAMFCTGSKNIEELKKAKIHLTDKTT